MKKLLIVSGIEVFDKLKKYLNLGNEVDLPKLEIVDIYYLNRDIYGSYDKGKIEISKKFISKLKYFDNFSSEYHRRYQRLVEILAHEMLHHIQYKILGYNLSASNYISNLDNNKLEWLKEFQANLGGYLTALDYFKISYVDGFIYDREYKYSIINVIEKKYTKAMYDGAKVFISVLDQPEKGWLIVRSILEDLKKLGCIADETLYKDSLNESYKKWKRVVWNRRKNNEVVKIYSTS